MNDSGQVAGSSNTAGGNTHAFLSGSNGGALRDLGTLGRTSSFGYGVNASGQVAGLSATAGGDFHAFLSSSNGGALHDLGTLGGTFSDGFGVNASGQVVGYSTTIGGATLAFLYTGNVMIDLNTLIAPGSGFILQRALSISDTGYITAYGTINGANHAFLLIPVAAAAVPEPSTLVSVGLGVLAGVGALLRRRRAA